MGIWLNMQTEGGDERPFAITKSHTVIGRDTRCDVRVALPSVSARHCELAVEGALLTLTDLGSPNGTFRNGERVEKVILSPGDRLTVGPVTFIVRMDSDAAASMAPDAAAVHIVTPGLNGHTAPADVHIAPDAGAA